MRRATQAIHALFAFSLLGCGLASSIQSTPKPVVAAQWLGGFAQGQNGMNGDVYAMATMNNKLVAGGAFTVAGQQIALRIAEWNGTTWSSLGDGFNGDVNAVIGWSGTWVAGGSFTTSGGIPMSYIAKWIGPLWDGMNPGMDGAVGGLTLYKSEIFAAIPGLVDATIGRIRRWSGSNWINTTGGLNGKEYCFTQYGNNLIVGGQFMYDITNQSLGVAKADVSSGWNWSPVSGYNEGTPRALEVYHGELIVGGLTKAGGAAVNNIARWDGISWKTLGTGLNGQVRGFTIWNDRLIAVGEFTEAGGSPANHIAAWDGTTWSALGDGLNGNAYSVTVLGDQLFVGGAFTTAGGIPSDHIAVWGTPP